MPLPCVCGDVSGYHWQCVSRPAVIAFLFSHGHIKYTIVICFCRGWLRHHKGNLSVTDVWVQSICIKKCACFPFVTKNVHAFHASWEMCMHCICNETCACNLSSMKHVQVSKPYFLSCLAILPLQGQHSNHLFFRLVSENLEGRHSIGIAELNSAVINRNRIQVLIYIRRFSRVLWVWKEW